MQEVIGSTPIFSTHIEQRRATAARRFSVSIHLARVGPKQAIDKARSHERIEQKNSTNRAHERGIPGWLGNEERGQEEKGDDQSNDSLGLVLIR